ncbi:MAG: hypothetical protein M3088_06785 [Actinomycetota bacterium]|nr:hypothetical protein [Actinomycetota bacterium]
MEVRLLDLSVSAFQHASAHHDALFREFALIRSREPSEGHDLPARLLDLVEELDERFAGLSAGPRAEIEAAAERGTETIDVTYLVPPETREGVIRLAELLARADEYCRQGELLTVAPPPDAVAFRNWFLREFAVQIEGVRPTPWPEYKADI